MFLMPREALLASGFYFFQGIIYGGMGLTDSSMGYFEGLDGTADLRSFFDEPVSNPPDAGPPYSGGDPSLYGDLAPHMEGLPLRDLCVKLSGLSPEDASTLVEFGCMWLDGVQKTDPGLPLPATGLFRLNFPAYGPKKFYETDPSRIVFEDPDMIVYHKESGRPTQGVPYDGYNNVHSGLMRLRGIFLRLPHRLDMGTSGLLLISKNLKAAGFLGKCFQKGIVKKRYLALARGAPPDWEEKDVTASIAKIQNRFTARERGPGLPSWTSFKVLAARDGLVLFLAVPHTGRTHQIRLHLNLLGYPIIGDYIYGGPNYKRLMLRASGIAFRHPISHLPMVMGGPWDTDPDI
jgi:23S rRNA pseudouridine1911/1915/1917 synthase